MGILRGKTVQSADEDYSIQKALVAVTVEKTLLDIGKPSYDKVAMILKKEYNCYLPDCYEHPQYLIKVLKEIYGNAHTAIIESINKQLEFSYHGSTKRFLSVISQ